MINEADIQEIVSLDYEILDVVLEGQLRKLFKAHNQVLTDEMIKVLVPLQWMIYSRQNWWRL